MDNRPARVKNITAFRESALNIRFRFPAGYTVTDPSVFFRVDRQLYDLLLTPTIDGRILTIAVPAGEVAKFPNRIDLYLTRAGVALLTVSVYVQMGGEEETDPDGFYDVTIVDDQVITVYVPGLVEVQAQVELAIEQVALATEQAELATTEKEIATAQAVISEAQAVIATAKAALTAADRTQTGLDRVQTGIDKAATAADRVQTGQDRVATAADRVQTGLDKLATAADRLQTGIDRVTAALSASDALTSANNSANAVTNGVQQRFTKGVISKIAKPIVYASTGLVIFSIDSKSAGTGSGGSFTTIRRPFEALMRGNFGDCGPGYHAFHNDIAVERGVSYGKSNMSDVTLTTITGTVGTPTEKFGNYAWDGYGQYRPVGATGTGSIDWNFNQKWDNCRLFYLKQPSGGTFSARCSNLTAGQATAVDTANATFDLGYIDITYVGSGAVGLAMNLITANVVIFGGFFTLTGVKPVGVLPMCQGGRRLSDVAAQDSTIRRKWIAEFSPSHLFIDGGTNDRAFDNATVHGANLTSVITDFQAASPTCNVIIVQSNDPQDAATTFYPSYTAKKIEVAEALGCSYIDDRDVLGGGYTYTNSKGLMLDGVHLSDLGNKVVVRGRAEHIGLQIAVNDPGKTPSPGGGSSTIVPSGTLTPKRGAGSPSFAVGTPIVLWTLGLGQAFPTALLKINVYANRYNTSIYAHREFECRISSSSASLNAATGATDPLDIGNTLKFKELNRTGDSQATDITFTLAISGGKAVVSITPLTNPWIMYVATAEYTIYSVNAGIQIFEN